MWLVKRERVRVSMRLTRRAVAKTVKGFNGFYIIVFIGMSLAEAKPGKHNAKAQARAKAREGYSQKDKESRMGREASTIKSSGW